MDREVRRAQMRKHGTHDQRTHGNWARGMQKPLHEDKQNTKLYAAVKVDGGFTIAEESGYVPEVGYMVSLPVSMGVEKIIPAHEITATDIANFREQWAEQLRKPEHYLGGWVDDNPKSDTYGSAFLDVSRRFHDKTEALAFGWAGKQKEGFDLSTFESFPIRSIDRNPRPAHLTKRGGWVFVPLDGLSDEQAAEAIRNAVTG